MVQKILRFKVYRNLEIVVRPGGDGEEWQHVELGGSMMEARRR
jgi:hypothetical protein